MHQPDAQFRQRRGEHPVTGLGRLVAQRLGFLDQRAHPVRLLPGLARGAHPLDDLVTARFRYGDSRNRLPAGRQFVDDGNVEIGIGGHRERARDRRRGHDQLMRMAVVAHALFPQRHALVHAEAMLLIDDDEAESTKADAFLEQCVRADDQRSAAIGDRGKGFAPRRRFLAAGEPGGLQPERPEPVGEALPVLLGEQLGRRHDRGLHAAGHRLETGDRGDDRLARADVALDEAHHRVRRRHVAEDFLRHALLRARQREWQPFDECVDPVLPAAERRRGLGIRDRAQVLQAEVVRQQFLEREALLARVTARNHQRDVRVGRRPVQVANGFRERGHREFTAYRIGQQLLRRRALHRLQCLTGQAAQPALLHALGRRVDRRERIVDGGILAVAQEPVLRVDHLEAGAALADFAETGHAHTVLELRLLVAREVEETQRELPAAVGDSHEQVAPAAKRRLGEQHFARHQASFAGNQCAQPDELRTVFVAQRQQEQQVFHPLEMQPFEFFRECRADPRQGRQR